MEEAAAKSGDEEEEDEEFADDFEEEDDDASPPSSPAGKSGKVEDGAEEEFFEDDFEEDEEPDSPVSPPSKSLNDTFGADEPMSPVSAVSEPPAGEAPGIDEPMSPDSPVSQQPGTEEALLPDSPASQQAEVPRADEPTSPDPPAELPGNDEAETPGSSPASAASPQQAEEPAQQADEPASPDSPAEPQGAGEAMPPDSLAEQPPDSPTSQPPADMQRDDEPMSPVSPESQVLRTDEPESPGLPASQPPADAPAEDLRTDEAEAAEVLRSDKPKAADEAEAEAAEVVRADEPEAADEAQASEVLRADGPEAADEAEAAEVLRTDEPEATGALRSEEPTQPAPSAEPVAEQAPIVPEAVSAVLPTSESTTQKNREDEIDQPMERELGDKRAAFVRPSELPLEDAPAATDSFEQDEGYVLYDDVAEVENPRTEDIRPGTPLNPGEEGEDEDPIDDDLVSPAMLRSDGAGRIGRGQQIEIKKSASAPSLAGSLAVARRQKIPSHVAAKRKALPPVGCTAQARQKLPPPVVQQEWDQRHHLAGVENEMLPKRLRAYFSKPQSEVELRDDLERRSNMSSMLKRMGEEEVPPTRPTKITGDAGPPVIPTKHEPGGSMRDRDKEIRPWNNRWSQGIGTLNDGMHPLHREYFAAGSLFAEAPSQRWRRYLDVEVAHGVWKPIQETRPPRFPPMGV